MNKKQNEYITTGKVKLRVWWIPQVPMKPFRVDVDNFKEAILLLNTLAKYDQFQFDNHIRPDYSNVGGLEYWEDDLDGIDNNGEKWCEWENEEGDDIWEYANGNKEINNLTND